VHRRLLKQSSFNEATYPRSSGWAATERRAASARQREQVSPESTLRVPTGIPERAPERVPRSRPDVM
jgi:hypothetical protein